MQFKELMNREAQKHIMILQQKSSNLPAAGTILPNGNAPGSENVAGSTEENKRAFEAAQITPRQEKKTPIKEEKPVLGQ